MATTYAPTTVWTVIAVIGLGTFAIRLSFIYLFGRIESVPPTVERALRYVPPAVFAALVVPRVVSVEPTLVATLLDEQVLAAVIAAAVAWRTGDIALTTIAGMLALWLFRFVVFA
jgi:branched-subunit amino acid transport protein